MTRTVGHIVDGGWTAIDVTIDVTIDDVRHHANRFRGCRRLVLRLAARILQRLDQ